MSYVKLFHKIFVETDNDLMVFVVDTATTETLIEAIAEIMLAHPEISDLVFAGTCPEDEVEFFGPHYNEVEFDSELELEGTLPQKGKDTIH